MEVTALVASMVVVTIVVIAAAVVAVVGVVGVVVVVVVGAGRLDEGEAGCLPCWPWTLALFFASIR